MNFRNEYYRKVLDSSITIDSVCFTEETRASEYIPLEGGYQINSDEVSASLQLRVAALER